MVSEWFDWYEGDYVVACIFQFSEYIISEAKIPNRKLHVLVQVY